MVKIAWSYGISLDALSTLDRRMDGRTDTSLSRSRNKDGKLEKIVKV